eukprot:scaffold244637_cov31-Prasinocladus_malaysianus.AAC.1
MACSAAVQWVTSTATPSCPVPWTGSNGVAGARDLASFSEYMVARWVMGLMDTTLHGIHIETLSGASSCIEVYILFKIAEGKIPFVDAVSYISKAIHTVES